MRIDKAIEASMAMKDTDWARHANPWSVYSRIPTLALFALAVWSRVWIGWWALLPVAAVVAWTLWNPRAFPPPASTRNWASKVTFGERVWLKRKETPIPRPPWRGGPSGCRSPAGSRCCPQSTDSSSSTRQPLHWARSWPRWLKLWFCDRMVWLYEDMIAEHAEHRAWLAP